MDLLAEHEEIRTEDIVQLAKEKGISKRTLEEARNELGVVAKKIHKKWYWTRDTEK